MIIETPTHTIITFATSDEAIAYKENYPHKSFIKVEGFKSYGNKTQPAVKILKPLTNH